MKTKTNLTNDNKLGEVKIYLDENFKEGSRCPACGRVVKLYNRGFNISMAYGLFLIYFLHQKKGFHKGIKMNDEIAALEIPANNIEYSKLRYWDLIQETDGNNNGHLGNWKITKKGVNFVTGKITIPQIAIVYNTKVLGFSEDHIYITQFRRENYKHHEAVWSLKKD